MWNDIYNQIVDIISTRSLKGGIILCKNMQCVNSDLLDILYNSYSIQTPIIYIYIYIYIYLNIKYTPGAKITKK